MNGWDCFTSHMRFLSIKKKKVNTSRHKISNRNKKLNHQWDNKFVLSKFFFFAYPNAPAITIKRSQIDIDWFTRTAYRQAQAPHRRCQRKAEWKIHKNWTVHGISLFAICKCFRGGTLSQLCHASMRTGARWSNKILSDARTRLWPRHATFRCSFVSSVCLADQYICISRYVWSGCSMNRYIRWPLWTCSVWHS